MSSGIRTIFILSLIGFLLELALGNIVLYALALWPVGAGFMPWQLVTYAFLHANLSHFGFNMLGLWMFGRELEIWLGSRALLRLYFASVLSAAATQLLFTGITGTVYPTVGASGGVFGILLAYAIFFPSRIVMLLIPPIPMPARLFVVLYATLELILGVTGSFAGVAHFAHLGGMLGGYLVIRHWRRVRRRRP